MKIEKASGQDLVWINRHYEQIKFKLSSPDDLQLYLTIDGLVASIGRLVRIDNENGELGGIYVLPEFRGRKLAQVIVNALIEKNPYKTLWCIPFEPLEAFYKKFGFRAVKEEVIPPEISSKVSWCEGRYPDRAILMVKRNP